MKTVEIAVVTLGDYVDYECYAQMPVHITDWAEVTIEEAEVLEQWIQSVKSIKGFKYTIVRKIPTSKVPSLISECRELADEFEKEKQRKAEELRIKREQRAKAKLEKEKEAKRKQYEQLKQEFEHVGS